MFTLLILVIIALIIDCAQTLDIRRHPGHYETNPILGRHPRDWKIVVYFLAWIVALIAMVTYCPSAEWTGSILAGILALEIWVIRGNRKLGISI